MKNKNTQVIKALVEETAPRLQELTYGEGDNQLVIKVYPVLPLVQRANMVKEIADGVFVGDGKTINSYRPEMLEFLRKYATIAYFTDAKLPKNIESLWIFLNYTPVYNDVADLIGDELKEIFLAADSMIETRRQYLVRKTDINSFVKTLGDALKGLESKISKEDIDKVTETLKGLSGGEPLQNIFKTLLGSNNA